MYCDKDADGRYSLMGMTAEEAHIAYLAMRAFRTGLLTLNKQENPEKSRLYQIAQRFERALVLLD